MVGNIGFGRLNLSSWIQIQKAYLKQIHAVPNRKNWPKTQSHLTGDEI
jgi:hypothetical protein